MATAIRSAALFFQHDDLQFDVLKCQLIVDKSQQLDGARIRYARATHLDASLFLRQLGMCLGEFAIQQKRSVGIKPFLQPM